MKNQILIVFLFMGAIVMGQQNTPPAWVARSNQDAKVLLDVEARFTPESAAQQGVEGVDDKVIDLGPNINQRHRAAIGEARTQLEKMLSVEQDPNVREDLQIMIDRANLQIKGIDLEEKYEIPYFSVGRMIYVSIHGLLDDQIAASRRPAALERLKKYAGMEPGTTPLGTEAEQRTTERLGNQKLIGPYRGEVEQDLSNAETYIAGVEKLFAKYKIAGYEEPLAKLKQQLSEYGDFIRAKVWPRARSGFQLPPEVYAYRLQQVGVDIPPEQLTAIAHDYFNEIQSEMMTLAPVVAKEKGYTVTDYRDVIKELKKDQWTGDSILPNYEKRVGEIEKIIRDEHLVTLPERPLKIELASEAETAQQPAPHMRAPRLIGNTGESGVFVLPLRIPPPPGAKADPSQQYDDFTYDAAAWTLTAHEGRPGHELQFDSMAQNGVSTARAIFAFNSVNAEGWGLYSEAILKPFMPADGQLVSLLHRLMRAARAFVDPELQSGEITPEQAKEILMKDVVLSDALANEEVQRYMYRAPGQATSYFYGYLQLMKTRSAAEKALGAKFNQEKFHDFIIAQGLLPPELLRKAVMEQFVPSQNQPATQ